MLWGLSSLRNTGPLQLQNLSALPADLDALRSISDRTNPISGIDQPLAKRGFRRSRAPIGALSPMRILRLANSATSVRRLISRKAVAEQSRSRAISARMAASTRHISDLNSLILRRFSFALLSMAKPLRFLPHKNK
jgi:hypothetical protein